MDGRRVQQLASSSSFHERKSLIIQRREVSSLSDTAAIITSIPTISPYFIVRVLFIYTYAYMILWYVYMILILCIKRNLGC